MPDVDVRRWIPIERIGKALYGDERWANKLAADIGISTAMMTMMKNGDRPISDKTLNRVLEMTVRKRIELMHVYSAIRLSTDSIAEILGPNRVVDIPSLDNNYEFNLAKFQVELDRLIRKQRDLLLKVINSNVGEAARSVIEYPSVENLKRLEDVLNETFGPEPDPEPAPAPEPGR